MEISGKIIVATEVRSGQSARTGNNWMAQDFVIETYEQYPRRCVFSVFGEDRLKEFNIKPGEELTVYFDIDAHEYNGRWFNNLRAWKVERGVAPVADASASAPYATATPTTAAPSPVSDAFNAPAPPTSGEGAKDDLPF